MKIEERTAFAYGGTVIDAALYFEEVIPLGGRQLLATVTDRDSELYGDYRGIPFPGEYPEASLLPEALKSDPAFEKLVSEAYHAGTSMIHMDGEAHYDSLDGNQVAARKHRREEKRWSGVLSGCQKKLRSGFGLKNCPFVAWDPNVRKTKNPSPSTDVVLSVSNLDLIDFSATTVEHVVALRKDRNSFEKIKGIREFFFDDYQEMASAEDELSRLVCEYLDAVKRWGFETVLSSMEMVVGPKTVLDQSFGGVFAAASGRSEPVAASEICNLDVNLAKASVCAYHTKSSTRRYLGGVSAVFMVNAQEERGAEITSGLMSEPGLGSKLKDLWFDLRRMPRPRVFELDFQRRLSDSGAVGQRRLR